MNFKSELNTQKWNNLNLQKPVFYGVKSRFHAIILLFVLFLHSCNSKSENSDYRVSGVKNPVVSLNGTWNISLEPHDSFWLNETDFSGWSEINVPGECQMQGFPIKHDQPFVYKHIFKVPGDFSGKQIFLDFYGVYSYARVWVNGHFVREHYGGFTQWMFNITDVVTPGEEAMLTVEVTDRIDDISYASGYAKHQIGGILRDVELRAAPRQHFQNLWYETDLDEDFMDAHLKFFYEMTENSPASVTIELFDKNDKLVESIVHEINTIKGELVVPVKNPDKWDAEHPNFYTAKISLSEDGKKTMTKLLNIGFREVVVEGNKLLVNGKPVKLRGANRHDIHPTLGRTTTAEYDKLDVLLAKEANINFIRTSHYPPSKAFLDYCDRYGMYVEDETAVCFVGSHRMNAYQSTGTTQNDSLYTDRYLSQLKEMVTSHRNHPSIIIWSVGNENVFGENFVHSYNWVKETDNTRPVIYSYPGQVPDSVKLFDILSMHYPNWKGNLTQYGITTAGFSYDKMPVLYDEWAHVACYNNDELKTDPNVRNFWGQSLDSMWTYVFEADGGLGGAIWCFIDETFMLPEDLPGFNEWWGIIDPNIIPSTYVGPTVGYGEWGIIDTWRRKKPEFWNTKKAYSPTKIYQNRIMDLVSGEVLKIPVHNRFDHTNFNEIKIDWKYGSHQGQITNYNLEPHAKGELIIPAQQWTESDSLHLSFFQNDTFLVDCYKLQLGSKNVILPMPEKGNLTLSENDEILEFSGENITYRVNKKTGLFEHISVNGKTIVKNGPFINLKIPGKGRYTSHEMYDHARNWKCTGFKYTLEEGIASIDISGNYDSIQASFNINFDGNGNLNVEYLISGAPAGNFIQEAGIVFNATDDFRKLNWSRDAYFSGFPEGHLGSNTGDVNLTVKTQTGYREKPEHQWEMDRQNFYYHGLDTVLTYPNIARGMKENIWHYSLQTDNDAGLTVVSDGSQAARFDHIEGEYSLYINDLWDYTSLGWGNYMKRVTITGDFKGSINLKIE
jgi:hypothetical protein